MSDELQVTVRKSGAIDADDPEYSHTVYLSRGNQTFRLDYRASEEECQWYANMLRKALGIEKE